MRIRNLIILGFLATGIFLVIACNDDTIFSPDELVLKKYESEFVLNPTGYTPISGSYSVHTDLIGQLRVTIKHIDGSGDDLIHTFERKDSIHDIPILGLYFDHDNEIIIDFLISDVVLNTETLSITTPVQPDYIPNVFIDVVQKEKMEPGMNFINYRSKRDPSVPFFVDHEGHLRYLLDYEGHMDLTNLNYDVGPERMKNGDFLFGNYPTNEVYQVDILGNVINQYILEGYTFHHTASERQNGNILVTLDKDGSMHPSGNLSLEDFIVEIDRNTGAIVNEWDIKNSIDPNRNVLGTNIFNGYIDWAHENGVIEDPSDNSIIISCRLQGVVKLSNDNVAKWILSNHRGWTSTGLGENITDKLLQPLDANGDPITDQDVLNGISNHPDFEWPWYQHAPSIDKDGNLWVFDNGDLRNFSSDQKYSRAVGYKIDEENMTVQQVWTYGKERGIETYSRIASDVDVEEVTGNILFCPGSRVINKDGIGSKIVELDYDTKEVVFEMHINSGGISFHRAERMPIYFN